MVLGCVYCIVVYQLIYNTKQPTYEQLIPDLHTFAHLTHQVAWFRKPSIHAPGPHLVDTDRPITNTSQVARGTDFCRRPPENY